MERRKCLVTAAICFIVWCAPSRADLGENTTLSTVLQASSGSSPAHETSAATPVSPSTSLLLSTSPVSMTTSVTPIVSSTVSLSSNMTDNPSSRSSSDSVLESSSSRSYVTSPAGGILTAISTSDLFTSVSSFVDSPTNTFALTSDYSALSKSSSTAFVTDHSASPFSDLSQTLVMPDSFSDSGIIESSQTPHVLQTHDIQTTSLPHISSVGDLQTTSVFASSKTTVPTSATSSLSSEMSTAATGTTTPHSSKPTQVGPTHNNEATPSSGISTGGKVAIGMVVSLCMLGIIVAGVVVHRRYNFTHRSLKSFLTSGVRYKTYNNATYKDDEVWKEGSGQAPTKTETK